MNLKPAERYSLLVRKGISIILSSAATLDVRLHNENNVEKYTTCKQKRHIKICQFTNNSSRIDEKSKLQLK